jgi:Protein of unknown function (DUF760)
MITHKPPYRYGSAHFRAIWDSAKLRLIIHDHQPGTPMNDSSAQILGSANATLGTDNALGQYIQALPEEAIARMHQPAPEAAKLMESNIMGMLGVLPSQAFDVAITTSKQDLGQWIASAMAYGYFLHTAEQRMALENTLPQLGL